MHDGRQRLKKWVNTHKQHAAYTHCTIQCTYSDTFFNVLCCAEQQTGIELKKWLQCQTADI